MTAGKTTFEVTFMLGDKPLFKDRIPGEAGASPTLNPTLTGIAFQTWNDLHKMGLKEPVFFDRVKVSGYLGTMVSHDFMRAAGITQEKLNELLAPPAKGPRPFFG